MDLINGVKGEQGNPGQKGEPGTPGIDGKWYFKKFILLNPNKID